MKPFVEKSLVVLLCLAPQLFARPNKQATIDTFCHQLREKFVEEIPAYFSGPDPWVEISELLPEFLDEAVATVYSEGSKMEWVALDINGNGGDDTGKDWYEHVDYFFDSTGNVLKRERHLEEAAANIVLDESKYYEKGKPWKDQVTHHPLANGKADSSQLFDPDAPEYLRTGDLPFPALAPSRRYWARAGSAHTNMQRLNAQRARLGAGKESRNTLALGPASLTPRPSCACFSKMQRARLGAGKESRNTLAGKGRGGVVAAKYLPPPPVRFAGEYSGVLEPANLTPRPSCEWSLENWLGRQAF